MKRYAAVGLGLLTSLSACMSECGTSSSAAPQVSVAVRGFDPGVPASAHPVAPVRGREEAGRPAPAVPRDAAADLEPFATAAPISGKSIGHTSVVLKVRLEGGLTAAYKPRSKRGPLRYKGEIAAYRLAMALGLPNVPPALPRSFAFAPMLAALGGKATDSGDLFAAEAIADDAGNVPGALIPWIADLSFLAIETDPLLSEWKGWLGGRDGTAEVPDEKKHLAAQISTLIVFDYVTGNWDRWSGGNVGLDAKHATVLFIDNDGAFYDAPPKGPLAAQKARLAAVARFSRSFVDELRKLDAKALEAAIGSEVNGKPEPLLSATALAGVEARRGEALAVIDARIAKAGEAATLVFP